MIREQMSLWSSISVRNTMLCLNIHPCLHFKVEVKLDLSTCQWSFIVSLRVKDTQKKLNEQQVRSLLRATCQRPNIREGNITKMVQVNNFELEELVTKEFGMHVRKELALINARVLNPPVLKYHDSGRDKIVNPSCGQWNMINKKMVNGGKVDFWSCVNFSSEYWNMSEEFCAELVNMCNNKGMVFCQTLSIAMRSARADRIDQILMDVYKESAGLKKPLQLLIIILPDQTGS
ncbi:hypothetical protein V6Z11_D09G106400 [Gossypium hirsutum]